MFAGWLIASIVWLLPFAESGRLAAIVGLTWLAGLGGFTHVIAGSIEVLFFMKTGALAWHRCAFGFMLPTWIGSILGGASLVAALNHAQVVSK